MTTDQKAVDAVKQRFTRWVGHPAPMKPLQPHWCDVDAMAAHVVALESNGHPDAKIRVTLSGKPSVDGERQPAPNMSTDANGMHPDYWVLSEEERSKGFVRPVRQSYFHEVCGSRTTMNLAIAETYARNPKFYGSTFCVACGGHYPVGEDGQFQWCGTSQKVGT